MIDEFLRPHATFLRLVADWKKYGSISVGYDFDHRKTIFGSLR